MLAEAILNALDRNQSLESALLAKAKAEYEAAQKKYEAAVETRFTYAREGSEKYDEACAAVTLTKSDLHAYEKNCEYYEGRMSATEVLAAIIRNTIKMYAGAEPALSGRQPA